MKNNSPSISGNNTNSTEEESLSLDDDELEEDLPPDE